MTEGENKNLRFSPPVTFGDSPLSEGAKGGYETSIEPIHVTAA